MLHIVASYHRMQFQGKLMIQTQENGEKPYFGPNLGPWAQIPAVKYFFSQKSRYHGQLSSCHHVQHLEKLMIQS